MKSKNICKFVTSDMSSQLMPTQFILESEPDAMKREISNPMHRMVLIARQSGRFCLDGCVRPCSAGDIIVFFENERYSFEGDADFRYMYIDFKGLRANDIFRRFNIHPANRQFAGFDGVIPLWMESLSRASAENVDLVAESILLYTFSKFPSESSSSDSCINDIMDITEEEFSDPQLSIGSIAKRLGYNPKYLSHLFKKKTGVGYSEYLQTYRIKYAITLFKNGIDSVKNVALLSGFSDPLYFSTVFKNKIGSSPKNYIRDFYKK